MGPAGILTPERHTVGPRGLARPGQAPCRDNVARLAEGFPSRHGACIFTFFPPNGWAGQTADGVDWA